MKEELFIPKEPLLETGDFIIRGDKKLLSFVKETIPFLEKKKKEILACFGVESKEKQIINLYIDKESIIKWREQFGERISYVDNDSIGYFTQEFNSVYCYFTFPKVDFEIVKRNIAHELVHLTYCSSFHLTKRITWFNEGLAQVLSGEHDDLLENDNLFAKWFYQNILGYGKILPDIKNLNQHGPLFMPPDKSYSGYALSFMMVSYIKEIMTKKEFQTLLKDENKILSLEENIMNNAILYYQDKFSNNKPKEYSKKGSTLG